MEKEHILVVDDEEGTVTSCEDAVDCYGFYRHRLYHRP